MKRGSIAVLLAAVILGLSACAWADEPPADAKTVKTTCEGPEGCKNLRLMSSLMTPNLFHMPIGKETPVKILGAEMLMKYDLVGNGCTLGLDLNLDGVIGKDEVVSSTGTYPTVTDFHVKGKKDGADIDAIVHVNFRSADLRDNRNMYFSLCINCCRKCTIDGVVVRVFDEDLDGKFMQDSAQKAAAPAEADYNLNPHRVVSDPRGV